MGRQKPSVVFTPLLLLLLKLFSCEFVLYDTVIGECIVEEPDSPVEAKDSKVDFSPISHYQNYPFFVNYPSNLSRKRQLQWNYRMLPLSNTIFVKCCVVMANMLDLDFSQLKKSL